MNLNQFVDKWLGKKCDLLFMKPSSTSIKLLVSFLKSRFRMFLGVFIPSSYFKIIQRIIGMVAIFMMNDFRTLKFSANLFLKKFSIPFTLPVGLMGYRFNNIFRMANLGAKRKFATPLSTFESLKKLTTIITLKYSQPRFIIAIPIAKPSFLAGWSLKGFTTLFAIIHHSSNYIGECVGVSI